MSAALIAAYRYKQKMDATNRDEGFVDEAKVEEPVERKILMLGLDGAGKSSLLQGLGSQQQQDKKEPQPTQGSNVLCLDRDNPPLAIWEIGGSESMRKYWSNFIQDTCALVYVVDSADVARLPESFTELHKVLGDDRLKGVPVIIVANKQDVTGAQSATEVLHSMSLDNISPREHPTHTLPTACPLLGEFQGVTDLHKLLNKVIS